MYVGCTDSFDSQVETVSCIGCVHRNSTALSIRDAEMRFSTLQIHSRKFCAEFCVVCMYVLCVVCEFYHMFIVYDLKCLTFTSAWNTRKIQPTSYARVSSFTTTKRSFFPCW